MRTRALALAITSALLLPSCASVTATPTAAETASSNAAIADQASLYSDLDNPMRPDEFQGATILDVERYRPTYRLTACTAAPVPKAEAADPKLAAAIAVAKAYSDEQQGVGLIVMKDGQLVHESYADGADETTLTASASQMKSVLALLYGIALDKGIIGSIDDPVGNYVAEWAGDPRGEITLRQMLTMSSGLGQANFMQMIFAPDVAAVALQTELATTPGSEFAYGNAVSKVLALALDHRVTAAGYASLEQFLHSELWCQMGGSEALIWLDAAGKMRGYAGLHANLRDWARIGEIIRNKGRANGRQIVSAAWIAAMAKPSAANAQYGLQVWLGREWTPQRAYSAANPVKVPHAEPFVAKDIVYFDGFGGQRVYVMPSKGLTIARSGLVNLQFDDSVLPNLLARAID
ncbi:serine hydrolase [Altererythrobacter sp. BO-6]|uniref:serine hydrolase domain-containing protein n=1 Tax=Altererythrobacter sp. BO-6 TaxID=2604537 RepID=UPI0013E176F5|nr:serine hydrolase [Altererythrobacter sp. BO-6]QIG53610.1 serine hydrolase [Altererythrobacter sp. BO-6]